MTDPDPSIESWPQLPLVAFALQCILCVILSALVLGRQRSRPSNASTSSPQTPLLRPSSLSPSPSPSSSSSSSSTSSSSAKRVEAFSGVDINNKKPDRAYVLIDARNNINMPGTPGFSPLVAATALEPLRLNDLGLISLHRFSDNRAALTASTGARRSRRLRGASPRRDALDVHVPGSSADASTQSEHPGAFVSTLCFSVSLLDFQSASRPSSAGSLTAQAAGQEDGGSDWDHDEDDIGVNHDGDDGDDGDFGVTSFAVLQQPIRLIFHSSFIPTPSQPIAIHFSNSADLNAYRLSGSAADTPPAEPRAPNCVIHTTEPIEMFERWELDADTDDELVDKGCTAGARLKRKVKGHRGGASSRTRLLGLVALIISYIQLVLHCWPYTSIDGLTTIIWTRMRSVPTFASPLMRSPETWADHPELHPLYRSFLQVFGSCSSISHMFVFDTAALFGLTPPPVRSAFWRQQDEHYLGVAEHSMPMQRFVAELANLVREMYRADDLLDETDLSAAGGSPRISQHLVDELEQSEILWDSLARTMTVDWYVLTQSLLWRLTSEHEVPDTRPSGYDAANWTFDQILDIQQDVQRGIDKAFLEVLARELKAERYGVCGNIVQAGQDTMALLDLVQRLGPWLSDHQGPAETRPQRQGAKWRYLNDSIRLHNTLRSLTPVLHRLAAFLETLAAAIPPIEAQCASLARDTLELISSFPSRPTPFFSPAWAKCAADHTQVRLRCAPDLQCPGAWCRRLDDPALTRESAGPTGTIRRRQTVTALKSADGSGTASRASQSDDAGDDLHGWAVFFLLPPHCLYFYTQHLARDLLKMQAEVGSRAMVATAAFDDWRFTVITEGAPRFTFHSP